MVASDKKKGVKKASEKKPTKKSRKRRQKNGSISIVLSSAINFFTVLVERFGWPGTFLILSYIFVERHATKTQKQEIIDKFLLGSGISDSYPLIILGIIAVGLFMAQNFYWKKRVSVLEGEIKRLSNWKSDHQESKIDIGLHHTKA